MKPILLYWRSIEDSEPQNFTAKAELSLVDQVPNPSKVLVILEELGLPYESSWVELEDLKKEPYESVNPNGRLPGMSMISRVV